ncbi:MAG TPA: D-Ala-D-Ala carboxypeptidase family metallohydrolase [Rhizobiaceae bacterium]|nr:D-Ala-D-Ala carboxypeptidase family metallohydrolase [Rhizobiaceae bacterium]
MTSAFLASCTTNGETTFSMTSPAYAPGVAGVMEQAAAEAAGTTADTTGSTEDSASNTSAAATQTAATQSPETSAPSSADKSLMSPEGDRELPSKIAYFPTTSPATIFPAVPKAPAQGAGAEPPSPQAATNTDVAKGAAAPAQTKSATASPQEGGVYVTATDPQQKPESAEPKKRGFLSSFFGTAPAAAAAPAQMRKPTPIIELASTGPAKPIVKASLATGATGSGESFLPGVRQEGLFEIKRKSGVDDDSDIDLHEDEGGGAVRVASAAGLARLAPNGLLTQTEGVDVSCLKPSLVRMLKIVEQHYGKKMVVTSGYRSPAHNRRARGAKNSQHMYCAAADVQVPGVSKWELAKFVRSMPGRGGVGTYCHTESVHIDVGPERDWNWRCRRRQS